MRRIPPLLLLSLLVLPLLAVPAHADDLPNAEPPAPKAEPPAPHAARLKWEEHFAEANQTHDGHLTLEEAKTGYRTIARHFHDIDVDGKGYVTENDVRAWHALQRANREHAKPTEDPLRPRNAFQQRTNNEQRTLNTSTNNMVPAPAETPRLVAQPQAQMEGGVQEPETDPGQ